MKTKRCICPYFLFLLLSLTQCIQEDPKPLNSSATKAYGVYKGRVAFWNSMPGGGAITIKIKNLTRSLTYYWDKAPDCDNSQTAGFVLEAGTYTYEAFNSSLKWTGVVTIYEGFCRLEQLKESNGKVIGLPFGAVAKSTYNSRVLASGAFWF